MSRETMQDEQQRVESVERALAILDCFKEGAESLSLAELARATGYYKSTILRLAASLERCGYLVRNDQGRFRLGPTLWRLGSLYQRSFDLGEIVRPELSRLVEETGETASYYVREGDMRVCLFRVNSPRALRHHLNEGDRLPMKGGATALVLSAFGGGQTPADEEVRAAGYAVSMGARDPDVAAVAVPVTDRAGKLRGALAVSGLLTRFDEKLRRHALGALQVGAGNLARLFPAATLN